MDKAVWQALKATFTDDEGVITDARIHAIAIPFETGIIPNPTEYDEQGEPLPQTFKDGYHVDIMTTEVIQEWKPYTVTSSSHWMHSFGGGEVVTDEDFE